MSKRKVHIWSHEEEQKLIDIILERGGDWKYICSNIFPHVSISGVKNMYYLLLKTDNSFKHQLELKKNNQSILKHTVGVVKQTNNSLSSEDHDWIIDNNEDN